MSFDDLLKAAWQGETPATQPQTLTRRVVQRRFRWALQRAAEVALTVVAVVVFGGAMLRGQLTASHWLLMPFFVLYLPMAWAILLRSPGRHAQHAAESVSAYARLRLVQLRTGLRDLWLARVAVRWLLGYAVVATIAMWLWAAESWQDAAWGLLGVAVVSLVVTTWLSLTLRQRWVREYRAVRRLT